MSNEVAIEGCHLITINRSRNRGGVACFVKSLAANIHKANMRLNTGTVFTEIHLCKSKPLIVGILYRPPYKIDFVNCKDQIFCEYSAQETQECFLLGDFKINLLITGKESSATKLKIVKKQMPPLTKKY